VLPVAEGAEEVRRIGTAHARIIAIGHDDQASQTPPQQRIGYATSSRRRRPATLSGFAGPIRLLPSPGESQGGQADRRGHPRIDRAGDRRGSYGTRFSHPSHIKVMLGLFAPEA
jgi:hypothetical protein